MSLFVLEVFILTPNLPHSVLREVMSCIYSSLLPLWRTVGLSGYFRNKTVVWQELHSKDRSHQGVSIEQTQGYPEHQEIRQ